MVNELYDVSISTMIGMLPSIINNNNQQISKEFEQIFDASTNRLVKSLYNPEGSVDVHVGTFKNVLTDNIIINDVSNFQNNILSRCNHNALNIDSRIYDAKDINDYAHSTTCIKHGDEKLSVIIDSLIHRVLEVESFSGKPTTTSVYGSSNVSSTKSILEDPNSYTLNDSVLFANKAQLMKLKLKQWQYMDIADGILYTYYDYCDVIIINDEYPASINGLPGSIVNIKFEDKKKKGFYKIVLSRKNNTCLRISKDELVRLKLVCIGNDETYGTEWDVESYSVRHPEDIAIVKK